MNAQTISKTLVLLVAALQLSGQTSSAPASRVRGLIDDSVRVVLGNHTHPFAQPQYDRGALPDDMPVEHMMLMLKRTPEQQQALDRLGEEQQDPSSANYHRWLTPEAFGERFGPAREDIEAVTGWLSAGGFTVHEVSKSGIIVEFSGTQRTLKSAFHTEMHSYTVDGEDHFANSSNPEIPAALEPVIAGFVGLHNFHPKAHGVVNLPGGNFASGRYMSPADFAVIYNLKQVYQAGLDGTGATIAVTAESNVNQYDIPDFRKMFGLPANNPPQVIVNGSDPGTRNPGLQGDLWETTADASWAGAVAPNAKVKIVVTQSTAASSGTDLSDKYIVDHNLADVLTESYEACEAKYYSAFHREITQQAASQGITWVAITGDSGSAGCDNPNDTAASQVLSVSYFDTPYVTAVGGTQFNDVANPDAYWTHPCSPNATVSTNGCALSGTIQTAKSYIPEVVWNEHCGNCQGQGLWASGGGMSTKYAKPSWQTGVFGIPNNGFRAVPDIAMAAAFHDGYALCAQQSCVGNNKAGVTVFSGTSMAAPAFAGIMALIVQHMQGRQGLANPTLYKLAAKQYGANGASPCNGSSTSMPPLSYCVFNDITSGKNAEPGQKTYNTSTETYVAGPGYDLATGLGSVNAYNLVMNWGH
jgi:pseudomonalisin